MTDLTDRAAGVMVASACGDALGAPYEFSPPSAIPAEIGMIGGGGFGWEPGEWTDDTSMAFVIAEVAARGQDLRSREAQDLIAAGWCEWMGQAKDVGIQTSSVLRTGGAVAESLRAASRRHHERSGRSGGNGSLMRTAPVALAFLDDPDALVEAATQISSLTHYDPEAGEACVLHCLSIRHAVLTGEVDLGIGLPHVAPVWEQRLAEALDRAPASYPNNGWVVAALQAAWSSITVGEGQVAQTLEAAVRGGHDTDTVACIAGAVVGGAGGVSAVPQQWLEILHGWPGRDAKDLVALADQMVLSP